MNSLIDPTIHASLQAKAALSQVGLRLDHLVKSFGDKAVLQGLSCSVAPGEIVCLLGPSGCGKTTALRIAAGLEKQERGKVWVQDQLVAGGHVFVSPEKRQIGLMFQDYALFPHLTVADNVGFGLHKLAKKARAARVAELLSQVGLAGDAHCYPDMMSGGQCQRIALARAIAPRPAVMLLDEPFSGLDRRLRTALRRDMMAVLLQSEAAVLMVTHDPCEAMELADRIILMRDGKEVQTDTPRNLYEYPVDRDAANFLGEINEIEARVEDGYAISPLGAIRADKFRHGDRLRICLRPHCVRVASEGQGIGVEILYWRFHGAYSSVCAKFENAPGCIHFTTTDPDFPVRGKKINLLFDQEKIRLYHIDDAAHIPPPPCLGHEIA